MKNLDSLGSFYDLLDYVIRRADRFNVESTLDLYIFCEGYSIAMLMSGGKDLDFESFNEFNDFVREEYEVNAELNWGRIIKFYTGTNVDSLKKFSELLSEYKKIKM